MTYQEKPMADPTEEKPCANCGSAGDQPCDPGCPKPRAAPRVVHVIVPTPARETPGAPSLPSTPAEMREAAALMAERWIAASTTDDARDVSKWIAEDIRAQRVAPLRRCDDAAQAWQEVAEGLERESVLRAKLAVVETDIDDVWRWHGDGYDHPGSLSCPVVMSAETLRAFVAREREGEAREARLRRVLSTLHGVIDARHHGRMPDEVASAMAAALAALTQTTR